MSRIWAVARHMIAEGIRTKTAVVFMAVMAVILLALPFTVAGDGVTLKSRIQSYLSYSLGSVSFLLSLLTVFLACSSLAGEIRDRQIFMVVAKPIARWQFFAGKWLGIVVLDAMLLVGCGAAVWGASAYLRSRPTFPEDRAAVESEVMSVRYGARLQEPDFAPMVEDRIRRLREEGRLDDVSGDGLRRIRQDIHDELKAGWRTLGPGQYKDFSFGNLLVARDENTWLHLHFKPHSTAGVEDVVFRARWQCGDRSDVNTLMPMAEGEFIVNRFHDVPVSALAVNSQGLLHVRLQNTSDRDGINFEGSDTFELLYGIGTFHWNLFRALTLLWCRLAFLAALGLAASTFLSFPIAAFVCFVIFFTAIAYGFVSEAIPSTWIAPGESLRLLSILVQLFTDPARGLWALIRYILHACGVLALLLAPDFSKYDPVGTVVAGRVVPLVWVLQSLVRLVLLQGFVLGAIGAAVFTRRELARVVV